MTKQNYEKFVVGVALLLALSAPTVFGFAPRRLGVGTQSELKTTTSKSTLSSSFQHQHHYSPMTFHLKEKSLFTLNMASDSDDEEKSPVKIIISGAPASGKGTQCEGIKEKYGVVHLSTGDMLRAAVAAQTEVGKSAKEFMNAGKLVPDDVIIGIVKDRLDEDDCVSNGWLLDGFPRTKAQADALADAGICADCFLFLNVPDEALVERVIGRRTDPETGKIYHMTFSPPPEDILPRVEQRSDDTEEKVKVRLEQFHANEDAVKGSYIDIAIAIDGNQAPDKVGEDISKAISSKLA